MHKSYPMLEKISTKALASKDKIFPIEVLKQSEKNK